jgi:hypothetical protein
VLAEALAVVAREDDHGVLREALLLERLARGDPVVDPADCREIGARRVAAEGLELRRRRVLVHVHEVEVEEERRAAVVAASSREAPTTRSPWGQMPAFGSRAPAPAGKT